MEFLTNDKHRNELRRLGFAAQCLKDVTKALGVDLTACLNDIIRPTADKRCAEGKAIIARLICMPASLAAQRKLWSSRVLAKISLGRGLCVLMMSLALPLHTDE